MCARAHAPPPIISKKPGQSEHRVPGSSLLLAALHGMEAIKVVHCGAWGVGKSTLLIRMTTGVVTLEPPYALDPVSISVETDGRSCHVVRRCRCHRVPCLFRSSLLSLLLSAQGLWEVSGRCVEEAVVGDFLRSLLTGTLPSCTALIRARTTTG